MAKVQLAVKVVGRRGGIRWENRKSGYLTYEEAYDPGIMEEARQEVESEARELQTSLADL